MDDPIIQTYIMLETKLCNLCGDFAIITLQGFDVHLQKHHSVNIHRKEYLNIVSLHFLTGPEIEGIENLVSARVERFRKSESRSSDKVDVKREIEMILQDSDSEDEDDPDEPVLDDSVASDSNMQNDISEIQQKLFEDLGDSSDEEEDDEDINEEDNDMEKLLQEDNSESLKRKQEHPQVNVKKLKFSEEDSFDIFWKI